MKTIKVASVLFIFFLILAGCGSSSDKDYYDSAREKINNKNYAEALADYEMLLEKYPDSEYATEAKFEIGKLYHGKVIKNISAEESLDKAIIYYRMVYNAAPEINEAQKSLFMIGFIQANELNRLEDAEKTYNEFIDKYPDSELAVSAKEELKNLGVQPEEILSKKSDGKE